MQVLYQLSYGPMIDSTTLRLGFRCDIAYTGEGAGPAQDQTWRQTATSFP